MKQVLIVGAALVLGAAVGRYTVPTKVVTKVVESEKKRVETEKEKHTKTVTVKKKHPDGTEETTTTTVSDSNSTTDTKSTNDSRSETIVSRANPVHVQALAALGSKAAPQVDYGVAVSRAILGPITAGGFFLTSGIYGVSLGLEF